MAAVAKAPGRIDLKYAVGSRDGDSNAGTEVGVAQSASDNTTVRSSEFDEPSQGDVEHA